MMDETKEAVSNQWLVIVIKTVLVVATVFQTATVIPGCGTPNKRRLQTNTTKQIKRTVKKKD